MKTIQVQVSEETHLELLKIQLERKVNKKPRTNIADIASDVLADCLEKKNTSESKK